MAKPTMVHEVTRVDSRYSSGSSSSKRSCAETVHLRAKYGENEFILVNERLQNESVVNLIDKNAVYHRVCYQSLTNSDHMKRSKAKFLSISNETSPTSQNSPPLPKKRKTRSGDGIFDSTICFFCQDTSNTKPLHQMSTENVNNKLEDTVHKSNKENLKIRLHSSFDARSGDFKYHKHCWVNYVDRAKEPSYDKFENADDIHRKSVLIEVTTDDNYLTVHPWNAYNSIITNSEAERDFTTNVFMFPLIPAPASDISSVYTALKRSQTISTWFLRVYMRMIERLLLFIQATRQRDWKLHLEASTLMCQDICSMDRIKYRRMLPVYIADMKRLKQSDPGIWNAFMNGEFSVKQNSIPFTSIGMDHAGEQVNKIMKSKPEIRNFFKL
ncbi:hypothetical protein LOTGIDRAFT_155372 [Lottia gigantea]|uniref:Uncharacterized protein n=1 Tax=Lottia gigantea TaxID=225164 RepID=V3Z0P4_LOTGI|nr:hypothetical protein LOTGIDRAFT_155372 [Lottia gigantea]ESO84058.1 hypothetical protein LOTGIDRAFT_155372 [Lottia gigantea]